jgi:hypothetical protein
VRFCIAIDQRVLILMIAAGAYRSYIYSKKMPQPETKPETT